MKPYLFLHIPRTAGTSISTILPDGYTTSVEIKDLFSKGTKDKNGNSLHHALLYDYPAKIDDLFTFTFVRNPWDRVVSVFEHQVNNCNTWFAGHNKHNKFGNFLSVVKHFWEQDKLDFYLDGHLRRQSDYTHEGEKQIVDFYGRYETLSEDIDKLSSVCDMSLKLSDMPTLNFQRNRPRNYRSYYYNEALKVFVRELYRKEIELYGYEF